ncbi:hypothetical protein PAXRUDRAFT_172617 [Paxillus rubicundulus Ve08.2h10]|uniref:Retroviral polymerase SH3-like domain-containing protein n=1 Tax=Paxillus rubicundulus Ve08.2h10 TaxID=930991 RepID=A0A0D0DDN4_9AGAM|nr:hypothetical protein PAXRUDRAFT_172617 [Paxillus rubicundulus Ve08.2h10]
MSGSKLDPWARDGHWVGYNQDSNGYRIYWPDRGTIGVERSVHFDDRPTEVVMPICLTSHQVQIEGEREQVDERAEMVDQHDAKSEDDMQNASELPQTPAQPHTDHLGTNFKTSVPLCRSTQTRTKSAYAQRIWDGMGTHDGRPRG